MNRQPLFILAICFVLGIFFQDRFLLNDAAIYSVMMFCLVLLTSMFFQNYFLHKVRSVLLGLLFFGIGMIIHFYNTSGEPSGPPVKGKEAVVFIITQKLNSNEKYRKYEGAAQVGSLNFNSVIYIPRNSRELDFKHVYKAEAFVTKPYSPKYDFQFNYARYLQRKKIDYQVYISDDISSVQRTDLSVRDKIRQLRLEVLQKIDSSGMSGKSRAFLKGIILADRTEIDAETVRDFNRSGLVHLLAISGTHIVVIFGVFYFLMTRFMPLGFRRYAILASVCFIWLFAIFIGFGNSVLRSCIMLSVYFGFVLLQRKPDLLHALAVSALIILIMDSQQLFDVGFQLSFSAVLGIFWLNQPLLKYFPKPDHYVKKLIFNTVTISLSAQLATLPLVLYYFHQFSFVSLVANFIIVPFSEIIIVSSFLMAVLIAFGLGADLICRGYDFIIQMLLKTIHAFAEIDMLFYENIPMNLPEVLSVSVVVYYIRPMLLKFNFKNVRNLLMAAMIFLMIKSSFQIFENLREEILWHSFNKHDVFSIKKGNKVCFWISDKGEREKILQFIVRPYCSSRRIGHFEIKVFPEHVQKVVLNDRIYPVK
ncbi:ComEC/Rec2 family competence protein [Chryseobacterium pennipullorum]|uniref:ComEC/Rec2 family competence protein n=1 Tax=Chryseobacterium pennipullorum TaxID=2258963 RepID=UPI001E364A42|nr:ComEC/Rec2 family competence protein [Chryseobacterium pennipullorum]